MARRRNRPTAPRWTDASSRCLDAYRRIDEPTVRQRLLQLVRGMSEQSMAGDGGDEEPGTKG